MEKHKMGIKSIIELLSRYEKGECTEAEKAVVEQWFAQHGAAENSFDQMDAEQQQKWLDTLFVDIQKRNSTKSRIKTWPRISVAAAAVVILTLGLWLYDTPPPVQKLPAKSDLSRQINAITPGKNTATLTLANGEVINLSETKAGVAIDASRLTYSDGTAITPSLREGTTTQTHTNNEVVSSLHLPHHDGEVQMLTATTPRGGTYQVILPDDTRVWLNAASKISFPSKFTGAVRKVFLEGEAYFEVAKATRTLSGGAEKVPFIVEGSGQRVEVLGTHFNINSYSDEGAVKTTLLEGSVKVYNKARQASKGVLLSPNQQASLKKTGLSVTTLDPSEAVAWKNGDFIFDGEEIERVMRKIARWYNIDVEYRGAIPEGKLYGKVSRSKDIYQVLRVLELTKTVHFKIEGRSVIVSK